jgi:hypothetical protein
MKMPFGKYKGTELLVEEKFTSTNTGGCQNVRLDVGRNAATRCNHYNSERRDGVNVCKDCGFVWIGGQL